MTDSSLASMSSNKPYLVKAFYDWISDNELTPYIVVDVNVYGVLVPMNYVADGQIVLNIASSAVGHIVMGSDTIEFSARFGGKLEHITVPYGAIGAIYAKENGAGTSLPIEHPPEEQEALEEVTKKPKASLSSVSSTEQSSKADSSTKKKSKSKASLKVIK
ncbi:ClpXP protease specificity-enhancing factor [Litorilituus sediminis]|uniref:ClpXP protease specificity-enhancing factor n=1 Tax=Litorilituus sediminis TaxID=718192 RepID=A0A4P6PB08_9GAMM|nr:ClpXP protease specificity-enhancing factor [Litorilituus sediminis]QBG36807.1 ClpXP protease specificity-enhancing factor [Litorilituus sediminis]